MKQQNSQINEKMPNNTNSSNFKRISPVSEDYSISIESSRNDFFSESEVTSGKNQLLKTRLQTLIFDKGLSEADFYNSINLTKQDWYRISWGLWNPTLPLKIRIAKALNVDSRTIFPDSNSFQRFNTSKPKKNIYHYEGGNNKPSSNSEYKLGGLKNEQ